MKGFGSVRNFRQKILLNLTPKLVMWFSKLPVGFFKGPDPQYIRRWILRKFLFDGVPGPTR